MRCVQSNFHRKKIKKSPRATVLLKLTITLNYQHLHARSIISRACVNFDLLTRS